jgi:hypothetical protein
MANIPIWAGSSSFDIGNTPFGFYDYDEEFRVDADKVAMFITRRLGYPLVDVELQDLNFYAAFEEAVTTYGNEIYAYQIRDNQLSLEGASSTSNLNNNLLSSNFEPIVRLTEMYGAEAGTGGNVEYYSGSVDMVANQQSYDLSTLGGGIFGIEVKKVFYESPPASVKFYDPYVGTGMGQMNMMESFGFGGMSPAINFLMMPLNYDLAIIQQIEMSDTIRRSNYSFQIQDNQLKIFPIPTTGSGKIWFEYIKRQDRIDSTIQTGMDTRVTNVSNTPYTNPEYKRINSVGRQWVFEYSLALSKEMLGYVRGKYGSIPIPDSQVTLNQSDLIGAATAEKTSLIERLRSYLDETSRKSLLERRAQEAEFKQTELKQVPYTIYIG